MQTTLDSAQVLTIIDKFLQIYNTKHRACGSMFVNVDGKNPTSTNDKMEMFYEYMQDHNELSNENPLYVDVYEPDVDIVNIDSHDVFALITGKESSIKYLSLSFISLLTIGCDTIKELESAWSIIKL